MKISKTFFIIFLLFWSYILLIPIVCEAAGQQCVILLHGLARSHYSMSALESTLKQHNYIVINENYPSTKKSIEELANTYIQPMINKCQKYHPEKINFVTHSLGGIVLQEYLKKHEISKLSYIVMLGPPNHGSPLADLLHDNWLFRIITGPAGQELTTNRASVPNKLHLDRKYHVGIIAGDFSFVPFGNIFFHEANDGKVTVSSAQRNNMQDFIVLPVSHTFMMKNLLVKEQILYFLNFGKFIHKKNKL